MPERWLQIKGDPAVREFLFQQSRKTSLFDEHIDELHRAIFVLTTEKGVFHAKAHYSSSQLTCWFYDDPFNYRVYLQEEIFQKSFLDGFPPLSYESRQPKIEPDRIHIVLDEFKRLRFSDEQIYMRSASINRLNGMIGMNFSCDGSHYIEHDAFFKRLSQFGKEEV